MARVTVEVAGETFTTEYGLSPRAGVTQTHFPIPEGALIATPTTFASVYASAPVGSVIACRSGSSSYPTNITLSKRVTLQPYLSERPYFDGGNSARWLVFKAAITLRGFTFRNFTAPAGDEFEYGLMFPTGSSGAVIEQCVFTGFKGSTWRKARSPIYGFNKGKLTIRHNFFDDTAQDHIYIANCDDLLIENNHLRNANQDGVQMEPVTASIKVSPSTGNLGLRVVIRNNIVDGAKAAAGIWLDTDVIDPQVYNNLVTRCDRIGIFCEAVVNPIVFSNRVVGGYESIKILITPGSKVWNNDVSGSQHAHIVVRQDPRRNAYAPTLAMGSTWISSNTEIVNNSLSVNYGTFQIDTMDDGPKTATPTQPAYTPEYRGIEMLKRVEGNLMPRRTNGGTQVGLGTLDRNREYLTVAQAESRYPQVFRNNADPVPVTLPAELASIAGRSQVLPGLVLDLPVPA